MPTGREERAMGDTEVAGQPPADDGQELTEAAASQEPGSQAAPVPGTDGAGSAPPVADPDTKFQGADPATKFQG